MAVPMFYFFYQDITIGGFGFMYRYLFGIGIIFLALIVFLVSPDINRGLLSVKYSAVLSVPYLWAIVYSLMIWAVSMVEFKVITRGTFYVVYQLIAILAAAATLYLFGKKGIYLQLLAVIGADGIYIIQSIQEYGVGEFLTQYKDVILTFTEKTGMAMKEFELLGHSYAIGFFLAYFLLNFKEEKKHFLYAVIAALLFFLGLKRSVFLSVVLAVFMGYFLKIFKRNIKIVLNFMIVLAVIGGFLYVVAVSEGLFVWLEEIGINTNSRFWVFDQFRQYYDIGIGYLGKGIGFVVGSIANGDIILDFNGYEFGDIHNDFLRQYIELGFVGFFVWMWLFLKYRIKYFFHDLKGKDEFNHGVLTATLLFVIYITFLTENTNYHYYTTFASTIMIMGFRYEKFTEREAFMEEKL